MAGYYEEAQRAQEELLRDAGEAQELRRQLAAAQAEAREAQEIAKEHYQKAESAYARGLEHGHEDGAREARSKALEEAAQTAHTFVVFGREVGHRDAASNIEAAIRALSKGTDNG